MKLVLFDLDHTLLDGDSNHLWIEYLMAAGLAGPDAMQRQVDDHARYLAGQLDIVGYIEFQLSLLAGASVAEWLRRREDFLASCVAPRISVAARQTVEEHRAAGDCLLVISATHSFLAEGAGSVLGLDVLAAPAEVRDDAFTGRIAGEICYAERKGNAEQIAFLLIARSASTIFTAKGRFSSFSSFWGAYPPVFRFQDAPWVLAFNNARFANTRLAKPNSEKSWAVFFASPR